MGAIVIGHLPLGRMRRRTYFEQFALPAEPPLAFTTIGQAEVVQQTSASVRLRSNDTYIEVTALAGDLFRVGMFGDGRRIDYRSEAVAKSDWAPLAARIKSAADQVHISTETTTAKVALNPLRIGFTDGQQDFAVDDAER